MVGGGRGWWVEGGERLYLFIFSRGGGGTRNIIIFCVFQFIPTSSEKKIEAQFIRMSSNSFVCLPPQKKPEPQFIRMSSNSFIYSKKNTASQFLRLYSNSFVCLPIHSYVFSAGMVGMSSNSFVCLLGGDGGWRAGMVGGGGGTRLYLFIFSRGGGGARNIIILCVFQCIRMSSNSFVCLRKKIETQFIRMSSNSLGGVAPPNQDYYFAVHSYVFQLMGLDGGTPPNHYYYFAEIIIMNRFRFIIIISRK